MQLSISDCKGLLPASRSSLISADGCVVEVFPISKGKGLLIFESQKILFSTPFIEGNPFTRAKVGDGLSAEFVSQPMPRGLTSDFNPGNYSIERALAVDQTNESIIIDEKIVIKWQILVEKSIGYLKEKKLALSGFEFAPKLLGNIYWNDFVIASINEFKPNTNDGWTWCVEKAKMGEVTWASKLSELTLSMHESLGGYIHGDFHVGQILKEEENDQLWVIDFEGDPLVAHQERSKQSDKVVDIVSMCASFFHVGAVAIKKGANEIAVKSWIMEVEKEYLSGLGIAQNDVRRIHGYMIIFEDREIRYADTYLPEWRYAPDFAKKYMRDLGYGH